MGLFPMRRWFSRGSDEPQPKTRTETKTESREPTSHLPSKPSIKSMKPQPQPIELSRDKDRDRDEEVAVRASSRISRRMSRRDRISDIFGRPKKRGSVQVADAGIGLGTGTGTASGTVTGATGSSPPPQTVAAAAPATAATPIPVARQSLRPPDHNKPLPSPPSDASSEVNATPLRPILKLNRIMSTLTENEVEKLFSGAPQFFVRSEGQFTGSPHPSAAFPFDEELEIRDMTDHVQIEDKAWGGVTAWPHLTRDLIHDATAKRQAQDKHRPHFHIRCRERPNMLSMQGVEKGTMGFAAALELAVGDSLEEEQFGFDTLGTKARIIVETRQRMFSEAGFLHRIPQSSILDRLKRNSELYRENDLRQKRSIETYQDLFDGLMRPTTVVVDKKDQYSLANQINIIVKCLATANVWIDLSRVEWRIRLGQILWGEPDGDELEDATSIHEVGNADERAEERYWLLMQILLATELLLRMDAVSEGSESGAEIFRPIDVVNFERAATPTVKWCLILARRWLENIEIVKVETASAANTPAETNNVSGWLTSLASKISLYHPPAHEKDQTPRYHYSITGRHGQRQVDGLTHFARKIRWPGIEAHDRQISHNAQNAAYEKATPAGSPATISTSQSGYFGAWDVSHHSHNEKVQAQRRKLAAVLHASGWISKSYVFGLVLPGEALSHYLMATLLENDTEAITRLGSFANLCGGFVYAGKSFWSTSCIVGRVLAAGKGAAECMGWVSSDVVPEGQNEGWVNVDVEDVAEDMANLGRKARLWGKRRVERESSILGDGDENSVLPADFIIPHENNYAFPPPTVYVELRALELLSPATSVQPTPLSEITPTPMTGASKVPDLLTYPANISFSVSLNGETRSEYTFSLSYDISFVTAHPCAPSSRVRILSSPSSPTIQQIDVSGSDMLGGSRIEQRTGHPLHKYYNYTVIHISDLLLKQHAPLTQLLASPVARKPGYNKSRSNQNHVLVIDCITSFSERPLSPNVRRSTSSSFTPLSPLMDRTSSFAATAKMHLEARRRQFGSDMEILVRALCAQKGWNALISRRKRGCLACAIREAGALGWKVVVRVE